MHRLKVNTKTRNVSTAIGILNIENAANVNAPASQRFEHSRSRSRFRRSHPRRDALESE